MIHIFIINHFAGSKDLTKNLRTHLAKKKDFRYFVFNTIRAGFETEIVKRIQKYFEDEKLRFYCCGGSGTMRNMLNGFETFNNIEVAFFPCGLSNDFLKSFVDDISAFEHIDNLIEGKVVSVDYIKTNYGIALNTFSVGFDTKIEENMNSLRIYDILGEMMPYLLSLLRGVIFMKPRELGLCVDGEEFVGRYAEIVFSNGCVFGGMLYVSEYTDVTDGIGSYVAVSDIRGVSIIPILLDFMKKTKKKSSKRLSIGQCKRLEIQSMDGRPITVNLDGELIQAGNSCSVEMVQKGIHFVLPQSVKVQPRILQ